MNIQVKMFLQNCSKVESFLKKRRNRRKKSKIAEEKYFKIEAKRHKSFNPEEKLSKLVPKPGWPDLEPKTPGPASSKRLPPEENKDLSSESKTSPKTTSSTTASGQLPALVSSAVKRKGPGLL